MSIDFLHFENIPWDIKLHPTPKWTEIIGSAITREGQVNHWSIGPSQKPLADTGRIYLYIFIQIDDSNCIIDPNKSKSISTFNIEKLNDENPTDPTEMLRLASQLSRWMRLLRRPWLPRRHWQRRQHRQQRPSVWHGKMVWMMWFQHGEIGEPWCFILLPGIPKYV